MNIQNKKKNYGRISKLMMNMIDKRISFTHEIITNDAFNKDKYYLPVEELKRKYYGYYENKVFRINKDYMKIIIDDNIELFKNMYKTIGNLHTTINLFDIVCRYNAIKCAKYLYSIKYPKIDINTVLGPIGLCSLSHDFLSGKPNVVVPEKYIELSNWLYDELSDEILDYDCLFIILILTGKSHLLYLFSDKFTVATNKIINIFLNKIEDTKTIKWFIDVITKKEQLSEENCDLILRKFNIELWIYLYSIQEFDHKFHKLFPLIAERTDNIEFVKFICDKLEKNDTLYLNVYEARSCYICDENLLNYMRSRGLTINIVRANLVPYKAIKFYTDKYFNKSNGWKCLKKIYDRLEDRLENRLEDNFEDIECFDEENNLDEDFEDIELYKWKNKEMEIIITIELHNSLPSVVYEYSFHERSCGKIKIPYIQWNTNEDKILSKFRENINTYNNAVNDMLIYVNQYIENK